MPKSLVIVESPAKARTIKKYLGKDFQIMASVGHVRDLPPKSLGVDVKNDFQPEYVTIPGKEKVVKDLRSAARSADQIFLATDPDREGEAIAWHVASQLSNGKKEVGRVLFHEITPQAVRTAIDKPVPIDMQKVNAQQARRVMDRLVGYQVSPFLWKTITGGLSAGRVQSVALRLICERETEIEKFKVEEYWSITAHLRTERDDEFPVKLIRVDGEKFLIPDEKSARDLIEDLRGNTFGIEDIARKHTQRNPYPPFITSTLQQDASRRLRFTTQKTMMIAQQLYEGIDLGDEGTIGLITYMRTDSTRIVDEAVEAVRDLIARVYGAEYVPAKPRKFKTKPGVQDAHEAIRPTAADRSPEKMKSFLTTDQYKLYELIWLRFVASQMRPARFDVTTVDVRSGKYQFRATGTVPTFAGFLKAYEEPVDEDDEKKDDEKSLPVLSKDEKLALERLEPRQHFTQPPPRYTEASLVKELEVRQIGRPSTYAQIISTLRMRKYAAMKQGRFTPSDLGMAVNRILVLAFPDLFNVAFTARMEDALDRIETGELEWTGTLVDFYQPFNERLQSVNAQRSELKSTLTEETDETCEKCGKPMVIRWGRNGRFKACGGFPACRNTRPVNEDENAGMNSDEECGKCGEKMVVKTGRYGPFLACSGYPRCRETRPVNIGVDCPEEGCDGFLTARRSQKGRNFFGCSKYPSCRFVVWDTPVDRRCPGCDYPLMVEKQERSGRSALQCPSCKHRVRPTEQQPSGSNQANEADQADEADQAGQTLQEA